MNLEEEFKKLFQQWRKEFEKVQLTQFSENGFKKYKQLQEELKKIPKEKDEIQATIIETYQKKIAFLIEDLLKLRRIKIINSALNLKKIETENLLDFEKIFYQNLISSTKGYEKVKVYSDNDDIDEEALYNIIKEEKTIPKEKAILKEVTTPNEISIEPEEDSEQESTIVGQVEEEIPQNIKPLEKELDYRLVRFVEKCPPIVGIDLVNYGPFETDDIAYLPLSHVEILLAEGVVEEIEINDKY
ncbi:MAG: hypothetical protein BAJALOKI2v1_200020 [Promethearchaeota archaeon]|nr:MAG: hypothetical protein BAJALOKI2v1_200020 [Candidatus Lokiarchaeota archaeon]